MNNKPTISLGAKVFIYVLSFTFDTMTFLFTLSLWALGITTSWLGVGLALPIVAIVLNKFITILAFFIFIAIYWALDVGIGSKLQKLLLKKAFKRFLWPWLIKMLPLLGWLPMITFSNWLLIKLVEKHDKREEKKTREEKLEELEGYA